MVRWVHDPDFGWYDADNPLGNVPNLAPLLDTDVLRDPTGTYHPDIYATGAMPDPVITMANLQAMQNLPPEMQLAGAQSGTQAQQFLASIVQQQALAAQAAQRAQAEQEGGAFGPSALETLQTGPTVVPTPTPTPTPTITPTPTPQEGDREMRNGVEFIYRDGE